MLDNDAVAAFNVYGLPAEDNKDLFMASSTEFF